MEKESNELAVAKHTMHAKEAERLVTEILDYINPCFDIINAVQAITH